MDHFKERDYKPETRKKDHINLAFDARTDISVNDSRFNYEPMLGHHIDHVEPFSFLGKTFNYPFWVSSMTGGTEKAGEINKNLALVAGKYGFGMGLGSCRSLLYSNSHLKDFDVRDYLGHHLPLFANLGIAQVEQLLQQNRLEAIEELLALLRADGLIIHVNPLQEWLQPKGDQIHIKPLDTLNQVLSVANYPVVVKEVGQGMGPHSLKALMELPLAGIELAAFGGTNFSKLESMRQDSLQSAFESSLPFVGHTAADMCDIINTIITDNPTGKRPDIIVSGGIKTALDGYYYIEKLNTTAIFGQASAMLFYARESYELLDQFVSALIKEYLFAKAFLRLRVS